MANHLTWLEPDWPAPAWVGAACSVRTGGVSADGFAELNLGDHVGDTPESVHENRRRYARALGARPVFLKQVHGWDVVELTHDTPDGTQADVAVAAEAGVACTVMVADCLPVLLCHTEHRRVAAAHAGWRGLLGDGASGVVEAGVRALGVDAQATAGEVIAWLGPCIGSTAFEVGPEVREAFVRTDPLADACFLATGTGKWMANLPALARRRLAAAGVRSVSGNDGSRPWCTVSNPALFFSHRGGQGRSGRFAASVWIKAGA